jgi:pimeloyl-ACP methyl ester carboxylesterase
VECKLENITVYYEVFGEGRPIIMLHGWSGSCRHMISDMEPLFNRRTGWQRIYVDMPGHGKTPGEEWVTNQDHMLEVVLDFIDHVIPGQNFSVAGVSAGAYQARGIVYNKLPKIVGVLLVVPLIVADDAKRTRPPHVVLVEDPQLKAGLTQDEAEMLQMCVVQNQQILDALRAGSDPQIQEGDEQFQLKIRNNPANYSFSFDVDNLPGPCPAPALITAGRQDAVVGYGDAWKILDNYPRGSFAILDRAGHCLELEQQDLFRVLAGEWLDRVEEYTGAGK